MDWYDFQPSTSVVLAITTFDFAVVLTSAVAKRFVVSLDLIIVRVVSLEMGVEITVNFSIDIITCFAIFIILTGGDHRSSINQNLLNENHLVKEGLKQNNNFLLP